MRETPGLINFYNNLYFLHELIQKNYKMELYKYEMNDGKISSTIYKYKNSIDNRILTSEIEDISKLPKLLFKDTISYTNSGYNDTVIIVSTATGDLATEDYFDRYIINSKGQVDSIYHHNFGAGKLDGAEYFKYNGSNKLINSTKEYNLVFGPIFGEYTVYQYNGILSKKVIYTYTIDNIQENKIPELEPYKLFEYNLLGNIVAEKGIQKDTTLLKKWSYREDKYLKSYISYIDSSIQEESIWEYDSENNLIYEKLEIMQDGTFQSEASYKYEEVEVTTKDEATYNKITQINEMIFKSHHMYMLNGIYLLNDL